MPRYCLLGQVDPAGWRSTGRRHRAVWPELLEALRDAGWRNYSLFLREDGMLIGYAEADDLGGRPGAGGRHRGEHSLAGRRWPTLFATDGAPDESWELVPEVFHLEDQLRAAGR